MSENKTPEKKAPVKKEHKIVSATTGQQTTKEQAAKEVAQALMNQTHQSTAGLRIGAIVLWLAAIGFEVLALLVAIEKFAPKFLEAWIPLGSLVRART